MIRYIAIVKRVEGGLTESQLSQMLTEKSSLFGLEKVKLERLNYSPSHGAIVCECEAPHAEAVRKAFERAGIPCEEVFNCVTIPIPQPASMISELVNWPY